MRWLWQAVAIGLIALAATVLLSLATRGRVWRERGSAERGDTALIGSAGSQERLSGAGVNLRLGGPARGAAYCLAEGAEAPGSGPGASRREVIRSRGGIQSPVEARDPRWRAGAMQAVNDDVPQSPAVPSLSRLTDSHAAGRSLPAEPYRVAPSGWENRGVRERLRAEFSAWCPGLLGAPCQRCTGYWRGGILVKPASGVTAQGRRPVVGQVTTCPSWLEMGTRVRLLVPGWGAITRTCLDRGPQAATDGTWQFDILVATHAEALAAFGSRGRARGWAEVLQ